MNNEAYWIVRRHPQGGFAVLLGHALDDQMPSPPVAYAGVFGTVAEAVNAANRDPKARIVTIHEECFEPVL